MISSAFIKLVPKSSQQEITIEEVKHLFHYYKEITAKTGHQLSWNYAHSAFPYEIHDVLDMKENMLYLKGTNEKYFAMIVKIGADTIPLEETNESYNQTYIQILLPKGATNGDKGKANEFCKFLAKKLSGELHLFNSRIMYFYKRGS
ncbi:DUF1885 family protein [Priestia abyssalis]|uniref:DUF1885 family protein n=1 Tax=Priestia abyssalis TaxID=1221450 RepID=UPI000995C381|nr:DUF1885 family protein [Priestia abyssalis]